MRRKALGLMAAVEIRPQAGPQEAALSNSADIVIYGGAAGAGKTWTLLVDPLRYIGNPGFGAVIFRRTYKQIVMEGGLWDESERIYPLVGGRPRRGLLDWTFPSGARITFANLEHEDDKLQYQGAQIAYLGFDQLEHFTGGMFWYMLSRNRSTCGVRPCVRANCNPDPDSFLAGLLAWWLDEETGYPRAERAGAQRWLVRRGDELVWGESRAELQRRFPLLVPLSVAFVPGRVTDNQVLMTADPGYYGRLMALPTVEMERLLLGNWKIRPAAGKVFNRGWFGVVGAVPPGGVEVRHWDFAGTEKKQRGRDPDFTAGVKVRLVNGRYFVVDCVAGQMGPAESEEVFLNTSVQDALEARRTGTHYAVRWEEEPGSQSKRDTARLVAALVSKFHSHGLPVDAKGVRSAVDLVARSASMASMARVGGIDVVAGAWNEALLAEFHGFPDGQHDDRVSAGAGAFNAVLELSEQSGKSRVVEPAAVVDEEATGGW